MEVILFFLINLLMHFYHKNCTTCQVPCHVPCNSWDGLQDPWDPVMDGWTGWSRSSEKIHQETPSTQPGINMSASVSGRHSAFTITSSPKAKWSFYSFLAYFSSTNPSLFSSLPSDFHESLYKYIKFLRTLLDRSALIFHFTFFSVLCSCIFFLIPGVAFIFSARGEGIIFRFSLINVIGFFMSQIPVGESLYGTFVSPCL